ncbi:RteC domain-containing protein [Myroides sp. NP-2]|uniref:RteC domain-containing protein n=1 Tax=Myroides sp. NP-2 TaxID=2759945 RepID=UPI0015FC079E|nr:RteC domain-containing protein [Myroides sp. NP-2]MBB1149753.1 RteC domain-containing protein [Myroides sp. NP-2]
MKKKLSQCMQQKMQLIEKIEQISKISVEEWSAFTYQWRQLLQDMCTIAHSQGFRSHKEECFFYENQFAEVHYYYLYCREMALFHSSLPSLPNERNVYIDQKLQHFKQYRLQWFEQFTAFCATRLQTDYTEIKACVLAKDSHEDWPFFDPKYPAYNGAYFSALQLIIQQLEHEIFYGVTQCKPLDLKWKRPKTDLCLLVYAVCYCNGEPQERDNLIKWADAFGALFGIEISKNFFQMLHAFKKRKNITPNIVTAMYQFIKDKMDEDVK